MARIVNVCRRAEPDRGTLYRLTAGPGHRVVVEVVVWRPSTREVMRETVKISLILCTYNRCQSLAKTLDSVAASTLPEWVEWEVLVMDNNSHDQTREVVEDFCCRYPGRFRYLFECQQGKSYALNAGIRDARGDVLAFTDDDAIVEPEWLWNLTSALHSGEWSGAGGRIVPVWPRPIPSWLSTDDPATMGAFVAFDPRHRGRAAHTSPLRCEYGFSKGSV